MNKSDVFDDVRSTLFPLLFGDDQRSLVHIYHALILLYTCRVGGKVSIVYEGFSRSIHLLYTEKWRK